MKSLLAALVLWGTVTGAFPQGTVVFVNSALSKVKYQANEGVEVIDAPVGIRLGLFWGTNANDLVLAQPTVTVLQSGLFNGGAIFPIAGTAPGDVVYLKMAGWDPEAGDDWWASAHYGESGVVQSDPLGLTAGPGTPIWQGVAGTNPHRMRPFTVVRVRASQDINFPALSPRTYGDAPFELGATASSGLPIVYESSNPMVATVSGSTVTIVGSGTTTITAIQAGNATIGRMTLSRTLVVSKAPALIELFDLTTRYNGSPLRPRVTTTPPDLPVSFVFDPGPGSPVSPGIYSVSVLIQSPNYEGIARAEFTVQKALQSIEFAEVPRTTKEAPSFDLSVAASSGLAVTVTSSEPAVATVAGLVLTPHAAGISTLTATQSGDANYEPALPVSRQVHVDCLLRVSAVGAGQIEVEPTLASYPAGTSVRLTAVPAVGHGFIRWTGSLAGSANPADLSMDDNKTVSAVFASLAVTVTIEGAGAVRKDPDFPVYALGQTVVLQARPDRWRKFSHWSDGSTMNPRTIVVGEFNAYTAVFVPETPLETVTIGGVSREAPVGTPAVVMDGRFVVESNVYVRGMARVELVSTFPGASLLFTLDGSEPGLTSAFYTGPFLVKQPVVLRAIAYDVDFSRMAQSDPLSMLLLPQLLAGAAGGGGSVLVDPPEGAYHSDGTVRIAPVPAHGWTFLQWIGDATGRDPEVTLAMTRNRCVQAVFGAPLGQAVIGAGSVVRNPESALYPFGAKVCLTPVPAPGNTFAFWANAASGTNSPLSFDLTNAQSTVTAVFVPLASGFQAIAVVPDGFGSVSQAPAGGRQRQGTSVFLSAVPEMGQEFLAWDGDTNGTRNPLVVPMSRSWTIRARFTARPRLTLLACVDEQNPETIKVLVTGEYGASYSVEAGYTPGYPQWVERGVVETPFGSAQYTEPIPRDWSQRIYRVLKVAPLPSAP